MLIRRHLFDANSLLLSFFCLLQVSHDSETQCVFETTDPDDSDVVEAPDSRVILPHTQQNWTFGTIGVGVDQATTSWREHQHVFASHNCKLHTKPSPTATALGFCKRVKRTVLDQHAVDCLLVEGKFSSTWIPWIERARLSN